MGDHHQGEAVLARAVSSFCITARLCTGSSPAVGSSARRSEGPVDQRPRDRHSLALADRELARQAAYLPSEAEPGEQVAPADARLVVERSAGLRR